MFGWWGAHEGLPLRAVLWHPVRASLRSPVIPWLREQDVVCRVERLSAVKISGCGVLVLIGGWI